MTWWLASRAQCRWAAFIARYDESVSDTELGAKLRESQKRYQEYVEENRPIWKEEGIMFKKVRKTMGVTQKELSELIGISPQTLGRLEKGEPVRSRKMMKQSCQTALNLVDLQRKKQLINSKQKQKHKKKRAWGCPSSFGLPEIQFQSLLGE